MEVQKNQSITSNDESNNQQEIDKRIELVIDIGVLKNKAAIKYHSKIPQIINSLFMSDIVSVPLDFALDQENTDYNNIKFELECFKENNQKEEKILYCGWIQKFYESDTIQYSEQPQISSICDGKKKITISYIYEKLFYQLIDMLHQQQLEKPINKICVNALVPLNHNNQHSIFLTKCFETACKKITVKYSKSQISEKFDSIQYDLILKYDIQIILEQNNKKQLNQGKCIVNIDSPWITYYNQTSINNKTEIKIQYFKFNQETTQNIVNHFINRQFCDIQSVKLAQQDYCNMVYDAEVKNQEILIWILNFIINSLQSITKDEFAIGLPKHVIPVLQQTLQYTNTLLKPVANDLLKELLSQCTTYEQSTEQLDQQNKLQKLNDLIQNDPLKQIFNELNTHESIINWLIQNLNPEIRTTVLIQFMSSCTITDDQFNFIEYKQNIMYNLQKILSDLKNQQDYTFQLHGKEQKISNQHINQLIVELQKIHKLVQYKQFINQIACSQKDNISIIYLIQQFDYNIKFQSFEDAYKCIFQYIEKNYKVQFKSFNDILMFQQTNLVDQAQTLDQQRMQLDQIYYIVQEKDQQQLDQVLEKSSNQQQHNLIFTYIVSAAQNYLFLMNKRHQLNLLLDKEHQILSQDTVKVLQQKLQYIGIKNITSPNDDVKCEAQIQEIIKYKIKILNLVDVIEQVQDNNSIKNLINLTLKNYPCVLLKNQFKQYFIMHSLKYYPINSIQIKNIKDIKVSFNQVLCQNIRSRKLNSINQYILQNQEPKSMNTIVLGGGNVEETNKFYKENNFYFVKEDDKLLGGFEHMDQQNCVQSIQLQSLNNIFHINGNNQINFQQFDKFCLNQNKLNLYLGNDGFQGYFNQIEQKMQFCIVDNSCFLLNNNNCKQLAQSNYLKIQPSCLFNYNKIIEILQQNNIKIDKQNVSDFFLKHDLFQHQLAEIFSFASEDEFNKSFQQGKGKNRFNSKNQQKIDLIRINDWWLQVFQLQEQDFQKYQNSHFKYNDCDYEIKIPLQLLYIQFLKYVKEKLYLSFNLSHISLNKLAITMTTPCLAKSIQLNFIRECFSQLNFGDQINFVQEQISTILYLYYVSAINNKIMLSGYFLLINQYNTLTDLTLLYIQAQDYQQNFKKPQIKLVNYCEIESQKLDFVQIFFTILELEKLMPKYQLLEMPLKCVKKQLIALLQNLEIEQSTENIKIQLILKGQCSIEQQNSKFDSTQHKYIINEKFSQINDSQYLLEIFFKAEVLVSLQQEINKLIMDKSLHFLTKTNVVQYENQNIIIKEQIVNDSEVKSLKQKLTVLGVDKHNILHNQLQKNEDWIQQEIKTFDLINQGLQENAQIHAAGRGCLFVNDVKDDIDFDVKQIQL